MFWNTFVQLCNERGISPNRVCAELNFSKNAATKWKQGAMPRDTTLRKIADYLGVSADYLMGREPANTIPESVKAQIIPIKTRKIPILGEIACGEPIFANREYDSFFQASSDIQADFALIAKGDSMINARILDGDVVFIRQQDMVNNGEIAAVIIEDEATLKRVYYYPEKNKLVLQAENPAYEPLVYIGEELNTIRVLGKAVAFTSIVK